MSILNELKRRNVLRVAAAYVVTAWLAIQVVETILPAFGFGDAAVRIATIVFVIGLVPTLVFAWVFELTPDGLKKDADIDRSRPVARRSVKKLDRMIMVVLALALGYFAFDNFVMDPRREAVLREQNVSEVKQALEKGRTEARVGSFGDKSIAVLAFQDMSPNQDQEYLSDGISEELLNLLAKVPELRVISRSSAFSFKGKGVKLSQIAEELNASHILEGSVRKAGDQIRITAQLIEARSDTHLWSETFDRQLDDIFAIQDEISLAIVESLKQPLELDSTVSAQRAKVVSIDAYDLYLEGLHAYNQANIESWHTAKDYFTQALELEPDFADAWYRLARTLYQLFRRGSADLPSTEAAALRAIELDPSLGGALTVLSLIYPWDPESTPAMREKAFEYSPNDAWVVLQYGRALEWQYRPMEADQYISRAIQIDPLNLEYRVTYARFNMYRGRVEKSLAIVEDILDSHPDYAPAWEARGYNLAWYQGDLSGAVEALRRAIELDPNQPLWYAYLSTLFVALEDFENAKLWLDRFIAMGQYIALVQRQEYLLLRASGQIDAARELAMNQIADDGTLPVFFLLRLTGDLIEIEAWLEAEALVLEHRPYLLEFMDGPVPTGRWDLYHPQKRDGPGMLTFARYLQVIYRETGQVEKAGALAERLRFYGLEGELQVDLEPTANAYLYEAQKLASEGLNDKALSALEMAVSLGWRAHFFYSWQFYIRDNVLFRDFRDHPRFIALLERIKTDMERQRDVLASAPD